MSSAIVLVAGPIVPATSELTRKEQSWRVYAACRFKQTD
jgi:hypothetical protein